MKTSTFSEEHYVLRHVERGSAVADVCRQMGVSEATFDIWKKKYAHTATLHPSARAWQRFLLARAAA